MGQTPTDQVDVAGTTPNYPGTTPNYIAGRTLPATIRDLRQTLPSHRANADVHRLGMGKSQYPRRYRKPESQEKVEPFLPIRKRYQRGDRHRHNRRTAGPNVQCAPLCPQMQKATVTRKGKVRTTRCRHRALIGGAISCAIFLRKGPLPGLSQDSFRQAAPSKSARRRNVSPWRSRRGN